MMHRPVTFFALLVMVSAACAQGAPTDKQSASAVGGKLTTVQLVLLKKGSNFAGAGKPEGQQALGQHVAHLYKLNKEGLFLAAGPFVESSDKQGEVLGLIVVAAPTSERALQIESADPAIKAGLFSMESLPLMMETHVFGPWAEGGKFERLYFGFLDTGPARSPDSAKAEELQRLHLAFMEEQHAKGRLLAAGPFISESNRRGMVVYKAATIEEARQYAESDPMIKSGRLKVELHPWQVPIGALKNVTSP